MGVRVQMPLRLRLPGPDAAEGPAGEALDIALARGLGQALERAEAEVFTPRGGYARPRPMPPSFVWQDAGGRIDGPARARIEARIAAAIDRSLTDRRLHRDVDAAEVLPADASEPVDWRRMRGPVYRLHSYEGGPDEADIATGGDAPVVDSADLADFWWHWDGTEAALFDQLASYVRAFHAETRPRRAGAIFHGTRDGRTGIYALHFELHWSRTEFRFGRWRYLYLEQFRVVEERGLRRKSEPPTGSYRHEIVGDYSGPEQLRRLVTGPFLAANGLPETAPENESPPQSRLRAVSARAIDEFVAAHGAAADQVLSVLRTDLGSQYFFAVPRDSFLGERRWLLQGLWETREVARGEGEGVGEDGGGAAPPSGSPFGEPGAEPADGRGSLYPRVQVGGETLTLDLSPFLKEPSVDDLGQAGEPLKRLIRRIAYRLEMPEGRYCGAFLIAAAQIIGARAALAGEAAVVLPRATRRVEAGSGNLGDIDIEPEHTPAVQLLRFVGGTCPLVTQLTRVMTHVYSLPLVHKHHFGRYRGQPSGWLLHFHMVHTPAMTLSVGHLYMRACQVMMLQVLRASAVEIQTRIDNFDRYFPVFEGLVTGLVAEEAELRRLRDTLQRVLSMVAPSFQTSVSLAVTSWREARRALSTDISDQILNVSDAIGGIDMPRGRPFRRPDGSWAIRDAEGRAWTMAELEAAIQMRSSAAASIDPLINQLADIPEVVDIFRHRPWMARAYLWTLLNEIRANNVEITAEVSASFEYAFRSGKIREDLPNRDIPGTSVRLQGVHLLAHQAIGDAFARDHWYGTGVDYVFDVELGRLGLINFLEVSLTLTVAVLCPPAGAALGAVFAGIHYAQAEERMQISRAVTDPDALFDRAELELDLFMAELEIVLSIIPELGSISRGAARGAAVVGRQGLRRGAARLGVEARRALMRSVARQARHGLPRAFVAALATDRVMAMLLPQVLGPVIQAVDAEVRMMTAAAAPAAAAAAGTGAGAGTGAPDTEARPTSPEGIGFYARLDEHEPSPRDERRSSPGEQP